MIGLRRYDIFPHELETGEYCFWPGGDSWMARTPNGHLANISGHQVTEEADGTITVSPSILVRHTTGEVYHGYLEHGVWREV